MAIIHLYDQVAGLSTMSYREAPARIDQLKSQLDSERVAFIQAHDIPVEIYDFFDDNMTFISD